MCLTPAADPLLRPFLSAPDDDSARRCLQPLLAHHAEPVIHSILRKRWHLPFLSGKRDVETLEDTDREEIRSDVLTRLLRRLWDTRNCRETEPITDFPAYVAIATHRACDGHLARKYPERFRLRNRLRALLEDTPGLALWTRDGRHIAGFEVWRAEGRQPDRRRKLRQVSDEPYFFTREIAPGENAGEMPPAAVVARLLDWAGGPVPLEDLVSAAGALWVVRETTVQTFTYPGEESETEWEAPDPTASVEDLVGLRDLLQSLWQEIGLLPLPQKVALLLNLRGAPGTDALPLFPLTGVATRAEIAKALQMTPEEFAQIWDDLPLEDNAIADYLGCTRAQVIGLRKSAKRRLDRRLTALQRLPEAAIR